MNRRAAKREAHGLVADIIHAHLELGDMDDPDESPEDEARVDAALEEIERYHRRKSYGD
jgi:hypothetical protein